MYFILIVSKNVSYLKTYVLYFIYVFQLIHVLIFNAIDFIRKSRIRIFTNYIYCIPLRIHCNLSCIHCWQRNSSFLFMFFTSEMQLKLNICHCQTIPTDFPPFIFIYHEYLLSLQMQN